MIRLLRILICSAAVFLGGCGQKDMVVTPAMAQGLRVEAGGLLSDSIATGKVFWTTADGLPKEIGALNPQFVQVDVYRSNVTVQLVGGFRHEGLILLPTNVPPLPKKKNRVELAPGVYRYYAP